MTRESDIFINIFKVRKVCTLIYIMLNISIIILII